MWPVITGLCYHDNTWPITGWDAWWWVPNNTEKQPPHNYCYKRIRIILFIILGNCCLYMYYSQSNRQEAAIVGYDSLLSEPISHFISLFPGTRTSCCLFCGRSLTIHFLTRTVLKLTALSTCIIRIDNMLKQP